MYLSVSGDIIIFWESIGTAVFVVFFNGLNVTGWRDVFLFPIFTHPVLTKVTT